MKSKKMIGIAAGLTALILSAATLGGCGSTASYSESNDGGNYKTGDYEVDTGYDEYGETIYFDEDVAAEYDDTVEYDENGDYVDEGTSDSSMIELTSTETTTEQKLIVTWNLTMEAEHYDDAISQIRESVEENNGYIESESEYSYYDDTRYAYFTIRIPNENADEWMDGVSEYGTITNRSKDTVDATLEYVDTESRLNALRTEQETLMGMMEKTENVSDLITIQSELSNVNAQIESYESQLRALDNRVDYTTIYIDITEVSRESIEPQTIGQQIKETFLNSTDRLKTFFRGLLIGIIGHCITIAIIIVIIVGIVFLRRKIRSGRKDGDPEKKRRTKKERKLQKKEKRQRKVTPQKEENPQEEEVPQKEDTPQPDNPTEK